MPACDTFRGVVDAGQYKDYILVMLFLRDCHANFSDQPSADWSHRRMKKICCARHRFPRSIIQHAVWLNFRFPLSYRNSEDLLAERGIDLSYGTVRRCGFDVRAGLCTEIEKNASSSRSPLASGRGVRVDQRQAQVSVARCRSGGRSAG